MSDIKRSGFSDPVNILVGNDYSPNKPSNLIIGSWGLQKTLEPKELAEVTLNWEAPKTFSLEVLQGSSDDVYSESIIGNIDGTYSANDTQLATKTDLSGDLIVGDKIIIGDDPTRYTLTGISTVGLEIQFGLLMDIATDNLVIYKLSKTFDSSTDSRLITYNYPADKEVSIFGFGGYDFRGKWTGKGADLEWEDLNKVGLELSNDNLDYWVKNSNNSLSTDHIISANVLSLVVNATAFSIGDMISIGSKYDTYYEITDIEDDEITIFPNLQDSFEEYDSIWIKQESIDNYRTDINLGDLFGESEMTTLAGYRIYYKFNQALSDADRGELLKDLKLSEVSVSSSGISAYTYKAEDDSWNSVKAYFAILAYDGNGNESELEGSAWCITYPGQSSIISNTLNGLEMEITFDKITDNYKNPQLSIQMGLGDTSINGGYDVFLLDYIAPTPNPYYIGISTIKGKVRNTEFLIGDIIHIYDIRNGAKWAAHCMYNGYVEITNDQLIYGSIPTYLGVGSPASLDLKVQYLRVTDRETQSVITLDTLGRKKYLTDNPNTFSFDIDGGKSQGVVIESVDTEVSSGVEN